MFPKVPQSSLGIPRVPQLPPLNNPINNVLNFKNKHIFETIIYWLVVEPTHLKNMLVKLEIFPKFRGENKKYLKPPPTLPWEPTLP